MSQTTPKFRRSLLARSALIACGTTAAVMAMQPAVAQEAVQQLQKVQITGSSIKRIAAEAALPVQTFSQDDIKRTGVTSVTDFVQQLPVMQGFAVAADSVGGGGGGVTTASIHDVGARYTLVLLNGRRMAPSNSGTTIDINSIPLSAVERIEVLTDGASALYGADAIAGVVNFILKKGAAPFAIDVKAEKPQHGGANGTTVSISKGFGDIDTDGYSLFLSASTQKTERLKASQREFAKTGIINFPDPTTGKELQFFNGSSRSIPPNVTVRYKDASGASKSKSINPYLQINGSCPPAHVNLGDGQCYFDYTSTVEISPEIKRDGLFASGSVKLGNTGLRAFGDFAYNDAHIYANIAPYPAEFSLSKSSPLFAKYVQPYISPAAYNGMTSATVKYRLLDMGGRAYDYQSRTTHAVAGVEGELLGWDVNSALTVSRNNSPQNYVGGFPLADKFSAAIASGSIDPFPYAVGQMPANMVSALNATQYTGEYNTTDIKMTGFDARGSREVFKLGGGAAQLGIGGDYRTTRFTQTANKSVANAEILFDDPQPEYDMERKNYGAYAELLMPFSKKFELTTSLRYDTIGGVEDGMKRAKVGTENSASTYKVSGRYQPATNLLFRAAYGTGFKAATMQQIAQGQDDFGVTGGTYACPLSAANGLGGHPLAQYCDGKNQYEVFKGGNPELKPERSQQWSLGMVFEPLDSLSIKLDVWHVGIKDAVAEPDEALIMGNPNKYLSQFTTKTKASTGVKTLAIVLSPINIGRQENSGLDYDFLFKTKFDNAKWTNRLAGTYMWESTYTTPGTDDSWETSLGQYGSNAAVSFRHMIKLSSTYETGAWAHTLTGNYKSGYLDKHHDIDNCAVNTNDANQDCVDTQLTVPAYSTFDWQTSYTGFKGLTLTAGVFNLADKTPPLSLRNTGSHQLGYDPRYASPIGRTFYLSGTYKF